MDNDPPHAILKDAWMWKIIGFNYQLDIEDRSNSFIDLTLQKDNEIRRLRFLAPQDVQMEHDIAKLSGHLRILDVNYRQMDDIGVYVEDAEMYRAVSFWAREVIDLDVELKRKKAAFQLESGLFFSRVLARREFLYKIGVPPVTATRAPEI